MSLWVRGVNLLVMVLLAGCAQSAAAPGERLRPVADAVAGEVMPLFSVDDLAEAGSNFAVHEALPLPDGTVLLRWDPNANQGGDDREPLPDPRLDLLGADGTLMAVALPDLDGTVLDPAWFSLLVGTPDGRVYGWDGEGGRLVTRSAEGGWAVAPMNLTSRWRYQPLAAVGPDGSVYVGDDTAVQRLLPNGTVEHVIDVEQIISSPGPPPLDTALLPQPAARVRLTDPWGLSVGPDGTVFVSSREYIVAIDRDDVVRLVARTRDLLRQIGADDLDEPGGVPTMAHLGTDADGALLISDFYQQRIVRLVDGAATVVAQGVSLVGTGTGVAASPHGDLLVLTGPDRDVLAALGR